MSAHRRAFLVLVIVAFLQSIYYYSQLPETVASHFDGSGRPNGWSSRSAFFATYMGTVALYALIFMLLPYILARVPRSMVNLPNKEYWLAPERIDKTAAFIGSRLLWLGSATLLMTICAFQLVIETNLSMTGIFPSNKMWMLMGVYGVVTLAWLIYFITRFYKTSNHLS